MSDVLTPCFHCGESCPSGPVLTVERDGRSLPVCCEGCRAVSDLIFNSGLDRYYRFREGQARKADEDIEALGEVWRSCDDRRELWGVPSNDGSYDLLLQTEGVRCSACAWLIRSRLEPRDGVLRVQVDIGTGYTRIEWNPEQIALSDMALDLAAIGYRPHLPIAEHEERGRLAERRQAMLRLGVAGLGMMQVMMYAVGLYAGEAMGISAGAERFLEWTSLLVTIPVLFYSGRPFFEGALGGLRAGRMGMDVPVALAIGAAFTASAINFLRGTGEVYFDSVVMFIFFLSAARFVQLMQRHRNLQSGAALARLLPEWAQRVEGSETQTVLLGDLVEGQLVRVRPGEPFPADGVLRSGSTEVDESLLTGESHWVSKSPGDPVVGGSVNQSQSVDVEVTATGQASTVSALGRLLLQARMRPSRRATLAERTAGIFVFAVLLIATLSGAWWFSHDPARVLPVVLSILVVSCPCALSLAFPAATSAASRRLMESGTLLTRGDAIEALEKVDVAVFDKTGTLTCGAPELGDAVINSSHSKAALDLPEIYSIAAALESHSAHPLARAFRGHAGKLMTSEVNDLPHRGLEGRIDGHRWRIGSAELAGGSAAGVIEDGSVWLADDEGWLAQFPVRDALREDVKEVISVLGKQGLECLIASGDAPVAVERVAHSTGIKRWHAGMSPRDKMTLVRELRDQGHTVLMVGDGVNDGPVLAEANVSMTVQGATELANSAADLILTRPSMDGIPLAINLARETQRTVRQNMAWAIGYNAVALPLAMSGILQPWMAALGMSASSLLVVANSARLARGRAVSAEARQSVTNEVSDAQWNPKGKSA